MPIDPSIATPDENASLKNYLEKYGYLNPELDYNTILKNYRNLRKSEADRVAAAAAAEENSNMNINNQGGGMRRNARKSRRNARNARKSRRNTRKSRRNARKY